MRLLVITQTVDMSDSVLGFFLRWIEQLARRFDTVQVVCLREGEHLFPETVSVHSLGKERGGNRLEYTYRFYRYIWEERHTYDVVFVHMNQEYILLAGFLWKLLGKPLYFWRNHRRGTWKTSLAVAFCRTVFYTSRYSYTARYRKAIRMPVGIDTDRFFVSPDVVRKPNSILFLGRMSPVKRPEVFIEALGTLLARGISFTATIVGSPAPSDVHYYESLKARADTLGLYKRVEFLPAVPYDQTSMLYRTHDIFVNTTPSGAFDKTIIEAAACGCTVLAESIDFKEIAGAENYFDTESALVDRLASHLATGSGDDERSNMMCIAQEHSLTNLMEHFTKILTT